MIRSCFLAMALLLTPLAATEALAVQPDEILADPGLEARARMISREIRCPVCQGENIDDSNAPISRDLRLIIRERLVAGDSNDEVIDFVIARYGEFVLFNPRLSGWDWVLWLSGPAALVLALGGSWFVLRRRALAGPGPVSRLTDEEEARLRELLKD
ncbi:cytochrome c-type biogenesis protein CcmH [Xinfangfangia sp. D13-10-4-6]|uniref:cytochrome c-type biogenesis protein n=1 Tax=Pseudogemmobacter hezensis TaxID=2737662 RepID=UPI00155483F9|nr:cytochrome c-type biogenesis protein [Pseudogemmobacter hezensis]NPD15903.1 cytochrome c-type biogenesis protein CcmH [Pseudogemmobacter hezensis]